MCESRRIGCSFCTSSTVLWLSILLLVIPALVRAAAGDLDPSFGSGGKVLLDRIGPNKDQAYAASLQEDGKVVLQGVSQLRGSGFEKPAVVRLMPDGTPDPTFGTGGKLLTSGVDNAYYFSVGLQPDGKVLAAGSQGSDALLARFQADGTPDPSFATGGVTTLHMDQQNFFSAFAVQPDTKIVAVGNNGFADEGCCYWTFMIARYDQMGILDPGFGYNGTVTAFGCGYDDEAQAIAIQPDGKILVAGYTDCAGGIGVIRLNTNGTFDGSFGSGGEVLTQFADWTTASDIILQPDGKILLAGTSFSYSRSHFTLVRYNPDGSLDLSFGNGGIVLTPVTSFSETGAIQVQPDGRIVFAGTLRRSSGSTDFILIRYESSGALDASFGSGGMVRTDFYDGDDAGRAVVLLTDANILAAGSAEKDHQIDFAAARYDPNGILDTSYGTHGKVTVGFFGPGSELLSAVAVDSEGSILAAGSDTDGPLLARFLPNGGLDPTFGQGGISSTWMDGEAGVSGMAQTSDGKIVVVGNTYNGPFLARYDTGGSLDPTFGSQGIVQMHDTGIELVAMAIGSDGRIAVAGTAHVPDYAFVASRFKSDGSADTSFGNGGSVTTTIVPGTSQWPYGVAVQADGKIVLVGYEGDYGGAGDEIALIRYNTDGTLDMGFGSGGIALTNPTTGEEVAQTVAIQNDGKIVVGGSISGPDYPYPTDFLLARYLSDGTLDLAFGTGGITTTDFDGRQDNAYALAIHADGKIVLAGSSYTDGWSGASFVLSQYNPDGTPDMSFGTAGKVTTDFDFQYSGIFALAIQPDDDKIVAGGHVWNPATLYDFALARYDSSPITILPPSLPPAVPGTAYSQTLTATGGVTPYMFSIAVGTLPPGLNLSAAGLLSGTPEGGGSFVFTIRATDANSFSGSQTYSMDSVLLADDFEDGVFSWTTTDPAHWTESGGTLSGISGQAMAPLPWNPSGQTACSACTVEADVQTAGGSFNKVVLVGWYAGKEENVQLIMDQPLGRFVLKQRSGGAVVARGKGSWPIETGVNYHVSVQFDGTVFHVSVNGVSLFSVRADLIGGSLPAGNFGFRVRNTTGTFDNIMVY